MKKVVFLITVMSVSFSGFSQETKNHSKKSVNQEEQYVCLMTGPEQLERQQKLKTEVFSQVKNHKELNNGYAFYFKYDEMFLMKMTDYVIAENNCCPFLTFEIKLHSKDDVELKIIGPSNEAKEMMKMAFIDKK